MHVLNVFKPSDAPSKVGDRKHRFVFTILTQHGQHADSAEGAFDNFAAPGRPLAKCTSWKEGTLVISSPQTHTHTDMSDTEKMYEAMWSSGCQAEPIAMLDTKDAVLWRCPW